ncbi:MAG: hypothetical protein IPP73_12805 [Chitinophagaceae bacterium]|nr:hypothetical protein [Chitinophagaceae bacterium]
MKPVIHLPVKTSIYMAVILMLSIALGRYLSSLLVKKISWYWILSICLDWRRIHGIVCACHK